MAARIAQATRQSIQKSQQLIANPQLLALLLVIDLAAYFAGLLFWYGYVMTDASTPMWAWPFIPDCPFFGLLGGLGLLMVIAQSRWNGAAQAEGQRTLWVAAIISVAVWLSTYLPGVSSGWAQQGAMFALLSWSLLAAAIWFRQPPAWLLAIVAFGQIKYGIWTITAWLLYWRSTAELLGAPHFSFDSISMTIAHIGLLGQGIFLLTYFRPTRAAAVAALVWFGVSDFMDYGLGFYPAIPQQLISLETIQWSTITVTLALSAITWWLAQRPAQKMGMSANKAERAAQTV